MEKFISRSWAKSEESGFLVMSQLAFLLPADTVEKLDFLPRSQFLRQQAGFKKKALRVRQKG
jgi:hypothetical protein